MKRCSKCKIEKNKEEFSKNKAQIDGLHNQCKRCHKNDYINNVDKFKTKNETQYIKHKENRLIGSKKYNTLHKKEISINKHIYYLNNKKRIIQTHNFRNIQRRKEDVNFRILCNLRSRVNKFINGISKTQSTRKLVGCIIEELKQHLEKQFKEGMTWQNYGFYGWHIDHIIPCSSFDLSDPEQQKKCFHYTNLQPLWARDNLLKGDKIIENTKVSINN